MISLTIFWFSMRYKWRHFRQSNRKFLLTWSTWKNILDRMLQRHGKKKKQIIRYEIRKKMELIKEHQEKKWQNASWVALKAVSPNFVNRARSGRQNDIRINGMKALKCCTKLKDHIEKVRTIYVRKILIWEKVVKERHCQMWSKGKQSLVLIYLRNLKKRETI